MIDLSFLLIRSAVCYRYIIFALMISHLWSELRSSLLTSNTHISKNSLSAAISFAAVQDFQTKIVPLLELIGVDSAWYTRAMHRLLISGQRGLSLVDCLSLEIIEVKEIPFAFAFDNHFQVSYWIRHQLVSTSWFGGKRT